MINAVKKQNKRRTIEKGKVAILSKVIRKSFIEIILSRLKGGERGALDIREKNYHINVILL